MAFDFEKAINGEPTYCNGEQIFPIYYPERKGWIRDIEIPLFGWDKNGNFVPLSGELFPLSTDLLKRKVKATAYVYKDDIGVIRIRETKENYHLWGFICEKTFEVEI